jgi:hypothetical protein
LTEADTIPSEVRELVGSSIHSLEELEVFLFMRGASTRDFSAEQLSRELRLQESMVVTALQPLVMRKLVMQVGVTSPLRYQYGPQAPQARQAADKLAELYADNRMEVLMLISGNAIERIRQGALRRFSDAFRFSGRKKDG